ncbi:MAG: hypothetical protein WC729_28220 [Sphingomonas sp.]|jgi:hypothetical protein|uniref:DUF6894 family protein n=1 Tax=Sphingomonas sp. TaxID=28214 RepID=UPI0035633152
MQRYFFHVRNDVGHASDEEGVELADLNAACAKARRAAADIVAEEVAGDRDSIHLEIMVDDAGGRRVAALTVSATISLSVSSLIG